MNNDKSLLKDSERTICEVWSRVMGYHRPIQFWNKGKQAEWADRLKFTLEPKK